MSESRTPFDTIESAHGFVALLFEAVAEAKLTLDADTQAQANGDARRTDALRLASYNLAKLELHLNRSSRILNDLRSLRRLLYEERKKLGAAKNGAVRPINAPKAVPAAPTNGAPVAAA